MIKIQEHIEVQNPEKFLDKLAEDLWQVLNPKLVDNSDYKKASLIKKCQKYLAKMDNPEYVEEYANNSDEKATRHKKLLRHFLDNNSKKLKELIISRPSEFSNIKQEILNIIKEDDLYYYNQGKVKQTAFGELLSEKIFSYKNFRSSLYCTKLFEKLNAHSSTCIYCNDAILQIVDINKDSTKESKMRAYLDLDHFYPKSQNPFFAVSFFNLIPTCHSCNATDKGDKPFTIETHVHPYHEAFDDLYTFKVSVVTQLGATKTEIEIEKTGNKPMDRTLFDILLKTRYQYKLNAILDMINHYNNYKGHMGTENEKAFIDSFFKLKRVPKYRNEILKCEGGKLLRDILKSIDRPNNFFELQ